LFCLIIKRKREGVKDITVYKPIVFFVRRREGERFKKKQKDDSPKREEAPLEKIHSFD